MSAEQKSREFMVLFLFCLKEFKKFYIIISSDLQGRLCYHHRSVIIKETEVYFLKLYTTCRFPTQKNADL